MAKTIAFQLPKTILFLTALAGAVLEGVKCEANISNEIQDEDPTPIVMWHGMGDSCCFPFSLGAIKDKLNESIPNVYVLSLQIGSNIIQDMENGYLLHPDKQIKMACEIIAKDKKLVNGYNAIGFSQGGQFLRGLAQRCPTPPMKTLVSVGGQHQGVYGLPNCAALSTTMCDYMRRILNRAAYLNWVQNALVQATYWHDPLNEEEYKNYSTFIGEINNERVINQTYIDNLQKLENFVMIKFDKDTMVQPRESEWFGFYKPGQAKETQTLEESDLYLQDRLGLKQMNEQQKLKYLSVDGNHLKFKWDWFEENIVKPYLK